MNPAYAQVHFIMELASHPLPEECFIITAFNPMDEVLSYTENLSRNAQLRMMIEGNGFTCIEISGVSKDLSHKEESFLTDACKDQLMIWARTFNQRAIFRVKADELILLSCTQEKEEKTLGSFRKRWLGT